MSASIENLAKERNSSNLLVELTRVNEYLSARDADDNTLLHLAAVAKNDLLFTAALSVVQQHSQLLGAWMSKKNSVGWTPVHIAVVVNAVGVLALLQKNSFPGFVAALDVADCEGAYPHTLARQLYGDGGGEVGAFVNKLGVPAGSVLGYKCQFVPLKPALPAPLSFAKVPDGGIRVLCLDGGGSRGIMTIGMLKRLHLDMYAIAKVGNPSITPNDVHIADYFDLIAGTSTGALIAMALGQLRMTLDQVETMYMTLSSKMFGSISWLQLVTNWTRYNTYRLRAFIQKQFGDRFLTEHAAQGHHQPAICIVSANKATHKPHLFGNYARRVLSADAPPLTTACTMWQAGRATSAAPTYFHAKRVVENGGEELVDGGMTANNPVMLAYDEARWIWDAKESDFGFVLSLGTGLADDESSIPIDLLKGLLTNATDSNKWHTMFASHHDRLVDDKKYIRVNGPIAVAKLDIADAEELYALREAGTNAMGAYANHIAQSLRTIRTR
jgi:predicted patatin/cPLA2 family phospholipase